MNYYLNFVKKYALSVLLAFGIWINFSSCSGGAAEDLKNLIPGPGDGGSGGGGTDTTLPGTNNGIGSSSDLYVGVDPSSTTIAHVRQNSSFSTSCAVSSTTTSNEDITCYIDVPEGVLIYEPLSMVFNIPKDMCKYSSFEPYWFHNEEIGKGPGYLKFTVYQEIVKTASGTTITDDYRSTPDCIYADTATSSRTTDLGCSSAKEFTYDYNPLTGAISNKKCVYDHQETENQHNCCYGDIHYEVVKIVSETQGVSQSVSTVVVENTDTNWGGDLSQCIGGPGRTDWTTKSEQNLPVQEILYTIDGVKKTYTFKKAIDVIELNSIRSLHIANYFGTVSHTHTGFIASATTSEFPYYMEPIDDLNGSNLTFNSSYTGNPYYTFKCLDSAFETLHRINVVVRDWDTYADYVSYIESKGVSETPDRPGEIAPASNCEGLPGYCDDYLDNDDFLNVLMLGIGSYITDPASGTSRALNYPYLIYK